MLQRWATLAAPSRTSIAGLGGKMPCAVKLRVGRHTEGHMAVLALSLVRQESTRSLRRPCARGDRWRLAGRPAGPEAAKGSFVMLGWLSCEAQKQCIALS